jgi:hypothetical protein
VSCLPLNASGTIAPIGTQGNPCNGPRGRPDIPEVHGLILRIRAKEGCFRGVESDAIDGCVMVEVGDFSELSLRLAWLSMSLGWSLGLGRVAVFEGIRGPNFGTRVRRGCESFASVVPAHA